MVVLVVAVVVVVVVAAVRMEGVVGLAVKQPPGPTVVKPAAGQIKAPNSIIALILILLAIEYVVCAVRGKALPIM